MAIRPSVPEVITVNSEVLQTQIRDLLPSQNGFGSELQATNVITPIIDLTAAAEGSGLPVSLQQAISFDSQTTVTANNNTQTIQNSPGFYRLDCSFSLGSNSGGDESASVQITDGLTTKDILDLHIRDNVSNPAQSYGILNVSQTGQLSPGAMGGRLPQTQQAGFGLVGPLSQLLGQGARTLSRPGVGGALTGFGTGMAAEFFTDMFGNTKKLVITRKLQRDTKKLFMMTGGNLRVVSEQSNFFLGKNLSEEQILMILFKTFKNQGPYVTKAAVRKTRQTIRKLDTLEQLKAQMCPPRRAPARRRTMGSTTKVLQVK